VGQEIEAGLVDANYDVRGRHLTALELDVEEPPISTFYPWNAILWLRPPENA
jgi:hypothetical protein